MTEPGQEPEEQKLQLDAEELRDLSPREDDSAELKGGLPVCPETQRSNK